MSLAADISKAQILLETSRLLCILHLSRERGSHSCSGLYHISFSDDDV
jgi:hypothetical protein